MARDTEDIITAADGLAETLAPNYDMLGDSWRSFACEEINAFVALFEATGHDTLAEACLWEHAQGDEVGDDPAHLAIRGTVWRS